MRHKNILERNIGKGKSCGIEVGKSRTKRLPRPCTRIGYGSSSKLVIVVVAHMEKRRHLQLVRRGKLRYFKCSLIFFTF
jgi:hypothetical protein